MYREVISKKDYMVLDVFGDVLSVEDCRNLTREANELIDTGVAGTTAIILDLSKSAYISASFCGFLISISQKAKLRGIELVVIVLPESKSYEILKITNTDMVLNIFFSRQEMHRSLTNSKSKISMNGHGRSCNKSFF